MVAGGTAAAAWKAELLAAAGAAVEVYAADPGEELPALAGDPPRGSVVIHRRDWHEADLRGRRASPSAPSRTTTRRRSFAAAARAAGVPVNVIDKPAFCDFSFGSIVNRSPLVIGISTDGAAPVFAPGDPRQLEALLPRGFARWAAGRARAGARRVKASGLSFTAAAGSGSISPRTRSHIPNARPQQADFERLLAEVSGRGATAERGSVTLVGAGPGDPELLTLRAVRALQSADVILFDDLVSPEILDFARREAKNMLVGKTGHGPSCKQDEINALMVDARQGRQARGAAQRRRPDDLRPRRRGDRRLPRGRHRGRGGARHHRGAGRGQPARHLADAPRCTRAGCNMSPAMPRDGALPADIDWAASPTRPRPPSSTCR